MSRRHWPIRIAQNITRWICTGTVLSCYEWKSEIAEFWRSTDLYKLLGYLNNTTCSIIDDFFILYCRSFCCDLENHFGVRPFMLSRTAYRIIFSEKINRKSNAASLKIKIGMPLSKQPKMICVEVVIKRKPCTTVESWCVRRNVSSAPAAVLSRDWRHEFQERETVAQKTRIWTLSSERWLRCWNSKYVRFSKAPRYLWELWALSWVFSFRQ